ncbi:helix-turn-helix domain-containing protein [Streptomyces niveus]|uniref:helix-turn-helix domain-containing protein n=1 Tax=Streptomyces niveus TaxID=193462 RepID=UPI0035DD1D91
MPLKSNGVEIRRRRELTGMTLTEFAKKAGYTLTHVSQVELGNSNAGPRYLLAAAEILDCKIEEITDGAMPRPPRARSRATAGAA